MKVALLGAVLVAAMLLPAAYAQDIGGGVDVDGIWWLGVGLEQGDYFSYTLCHVNYKECRQFQMDVWIEGERTVGTENKWVAKAVVYDGSRVVKGEMELGQIAAEPSGGTPEIASYRDAFKSSVAWLAAFASSPAGGPEAPKEFRDVSWGKIANIGGQQVKPMYTESVSVPDGQYESVVIGWRAGGKTSQIWVAPDLPFPVKASTWTHVSEGDAPQEYAFDLLDYRRNVQSDPFASVVATAERDAHLGCPDLDRTPFVSLKTTTKNFTYGMEVLYKPENPKTGCDLEWLIKFTKKTDETEFLNHVQYDLLVTDTDLTPLRSLAQEEGVRYLYSPSGLADPLMPVSEEPGLRNYAIWVYGLAPRLQVPDFTKTPTDYLVIPIEVSQPDTVEESPSIPSWVKTNAGLWADGVVDDATFVAAVQYLADLDVIRIPPTEASGSGGPVPPFVKTNAGLWADGTIDDDTFLAGLQYLVQLGVIVV